jgi:hypothetical protein
MKQFARFFLILFVSFAMISIASCKEDDDDDDNNNNNPANSVEAKIATDSNIANPTDWKSASVSAVVVNNITTITAVGTDGSQLIITLPVDATGTYALNASNSSSPTVIFTEDPVASGTNPNLLFYGVDGSGSVAITKYDKTNKKISGTFQFQTIRLLSGVRRYFTLGEITDVPYL